MKNNKPLVSIIMATYNRAHFIVETLHSIQNQTFKNFECLIIDDGGTDDTLQVINPILNEDTRFQFLKRSVNYTKGLPGCRNFGLDIAKGEYIITSVNKVHVENYDLLIKNLLNSIEKEKIEKIKNLNRIEFKIGKLVLSPFRYIKSIFIKS